VTAIDTEPASSTENHSATTNLTTDQQDARRPHTPSRQRRTSCATDPIAAQGKHAPWHLAEPQLRAEHKPHQPHPGNKITNTARIQSCCTRDLFKSYQSRSANL